MQTTEQPEDSRQTKLQPEGAEDPSDGPSSSLPVSPSAPSPTNLPLQVEAGEAAAAQQCSLLEGSPQTAAPPRTEGSQSERSASTEVPSSNVCSDEDSNMQSGPEPSWLQAEPTQPVPLNIICDCVKEPDTPPCEQQTVQLVKEVRFYLQQILCHSEVNIALSAYHSEKEEIHRSVVCLHFSTAGTNPEGTVPTAAAEQKPARRTTSRERESLTLLTGNIIYEGVCTV